MADLDSWEILERAAAWLETECGFDVDQPLVLDTDDPVRLKEPGYDEGRPICVWVTSATPDHDPKVSYHNHHGGEQGYTYLSSSSKWKTMTPEQRQKAAEDYRRRAEARQAETRRRYDKAAEDAWLIYSRAQEVPEDFPYPAMKGVAVTQGVKYSTSVQRPPSGTEPEPAMLVPLFNAEGKFRSYQRIFADGFKAHFPKAEKTGMFYEFKGCGENARFCIVCEGWATGATIAKAANGVTVISVCDVGNIDPVCQALVRAGRFTPDRMLICGDNDWATGARDYLKALEQGKAEGKTPLDFNPGARAAKWTAERLGCRWTLPVPDRCVYPDGRKATDANDLYLSKAEECFTSRMDEAEAVGMAEKSVQDMLRQGWRGADQTAKEDAPEPPEQAKLPMAFIPFAAATKITVKPDIVKGLIPAIGIGYIYGPSCVFKTFVMMSIGLHVSEGRTLAGRKVKQRPVYYLLLEGSAGMGRRTCGLYLWTQQEKWELHGAYSFWPHPFSIMDPKQVNDLIRTILEAGHEGAMVVIDTQSQSIEGIDEDKSKEMTPVLGTAKRISEAIKGVVLLVAHTGKNEENGIKGSYTQKANVDFSLKLKRQKTANGNQAILSIDKEKEASDEQSLAFDIRIQEVGYDEDGDAVTTCVAIPTTEIREAQREDKKKQASEWIMRGFELLKKTIQDRNVVTIQVEDWRAVFYASYKGKSTDSKRSMFTQVNKKLTETGLICIEDNVLWIPENCSQQAQP